MNKSNRTQVQTDTAVNPSKQAAQKATPIDPEVLPKPKRRTFTAQYKARILAEVDACEPGEVGALLRREGLYSSHLSKWRAQRERGAAAGLKPKKRGRKRNENQALLDENKLLRQKLKRLEDELRKAQVVIDIQKKVAMLLNVPMAASENEQS